MAAAAEIHAGEVLYAALQDLKVKLPRKRFKEFQSHFAQRIVPHMSQDKPGQVPMIPVQELAEMLKPLKQTAEAMMAEGKDIETSVTDDKKQPATSSDSTCPGSAGAPSTTEAANPAATSSSSSSSSSSLPPPPPPPPPTTTTATTTTSSSSADAVVTENKVEDELSEGETADVTNQEAKSKSNNDNKNIEAPSKEQGAAGEETKHSSEEGLDSLLKEQKDTGKTQKTLDAQTIHREAEKLLSTKKPPLATMSPCSCRKSRCLKLYCECFASSVMCRPTCGCVNCKNTEEFQSERLVAIENILKRKPFAFHIQGRAYANTQSAKMLDSGCNCRKTLCLKKYCVCFNAGTYCKETCRCVDCKNIETDSKARLNHENKKFRAAVLKTQTEGTPSGGESNMELADTGPTSPGIKTDDANLGHEQSNKSNGSSPSGPDPANASTSSSTPTASASLKESRKAMHELVRAALSEVHAADAAAEMEDDDSDDDDDDEEDEPDLPVVNG